MTGSAVAIACLLVTTGAAFHLGGRVLVTAHRDLDSAQERSFGVLALLAGGLLLTDAAVVASLGGGPDQQAVLLLARTVMIDGVLVFGLLAVAELADLPAPRLLMALTLVASVVRVALWVSTDLVFTHTFDAGGAPVYGPWVLVTALPLLALAAGFTVLLAQHWRQPGDHRIMAVSAVLSLTIIFWSFFVGDPVLAETLTGLWVVPALAGGEVVSSRRVARLRGERRRLARHRDQLTAEVARTNERLQQALAVREDILSAASHELRTPMTPIAGMLELLQHRLDELSPDEVRDHLATIERNTLRLLALIEDMLAAVTTRSVSGAVGDPEPVDLRQLLTQVARSGGRPTASVSCPRGLEAVADPVHLEILVARLIDNARMYGAPPIELHAERRGSSVEVRVRDHGSGVPDDLAPRLFEPFTQASRGDRRTASGVGLGLSIAQATAESWHGSLRYEPADGGGSCFVLVLPAPAGSRTVA